MKKTLFLLLMLALGIVGVNAQESAFELLLEEYYPLDITFSFCGETADGNFLVVPGRCMVLKINPEGKVVGELDYELEGSGSPYEWTWISGLIDVPGDPSHHVIIAEAFDGYTQIGNVFHIVRFDDDLNYGPDDVTVVDLSDEVKNFWTRLPPRYLLEPDGSLCMAALAVKWDNSTGLMYTRITPQGDKTVVFDDGFDDPWPEIYDFSLKDDHYNMVVNFQEGQPLSNYLYYCEVSRDFESERVYCFTDGASYQTSLVYNNQADSLIWAIPYPHDYATPEWLSDSIFLLPTKVSGGVSTQGVGLWKMNSNFNLVDYAFFDVYNTGTMKDEILYTWNPVLANGEDVYLCYTTCKGVIGGPQQTVVCKLDMDLNLKWKRWYGGASQYHLVTGFILTSDGGCLFSGVGHPNGNANDPYPYVLKITPDGYCSIPENEPLLKPFGCHPNPVEDILHLEYSPDVTPRQAALYDLQGRLLHTQSNDLGNVRMGQLPAGTYILRITMEDGTTYSDRVVKQ